MARFIDGLSDIAAQYDHFILDIFGVIHNGIEPFAGTVECLRALQDSGKQVCLLSNSPNRARRAVEHMGEMGIARESYHHIVTSGEATHLAFREQVEEYGRDCWLVGTEMMAQVFEGCDVRLHDHPERASFILNSIPGTHKTAKATFMDNLKVAADKGLPMICANPDLVVNIGSEQYECAGTFAKYYEEELGGRVVYHGKPHQPVYEQCYELLGRPDKSSVCAVGDAFHTDITGANRFGVDCILNIEGIHEHEVRCPVHGGVDNARIETMLDEQQEKPNYVMVGFRW